MGALSKIFNLYKVYPDPPTLTEAITGPYKDYFIQAMTQDIKELKQHGTWTIILIKSVSGVHILSSTWAFKVKRFSNGILQKIKAAFYKNGDIQVERLY